MAETSRTVFQNFQNWLDGWQYWCSCVDPDINRDETVGWCVRAERKFQRRQWWTVRPNFPTAVYPFPKPASEVRKTILDHEWPAYTFRQWIFSIALAVSHLLAHGNFNLRICIVDPFLISLSSIEPLCVADVPGVYTECYHIARNSSGSIEWYHRNDYGMFVATNLNSIEGTPSEPCNLASIVPRKVCRTTKKAYNLCVYVMFFKYLQRTLLYNHTTSQIGAHRLSRNHRLQS